jgi:hypothetical protein
MRLDGNAELFAADLCSGPGRFLKIGGVEPRFLDQRIEIEEERLDSPGEGRLYDV